MEKKECFDTWINNKYENFKIFIKNNIKNRDSDKLDLLPVNAEEFLSYFCILDYDDVDEMIEQMSDTFNINKRNYDEEVYDKFKRYIEMFQDVNKQIQGE